MKSFAVRSERLTPVLAAFLVVACVGAAHAEAPEPWSSAGFMAGCRAFEDMASGELKAPVSFDAAFAAGHCYGVVDAAMATLTPEIACPPRGKETSDHIAAINKVIERYRESLSLDRSSPSSIAIQGLVIAYPCAG